jgi:hypothetical protein
VTELQIFSVPMNHAPPVADICKTFGPGVDPEPLGGIANHVLPNQFG